MRRCIPARPSTGDRLVAAAAAVWAADPSAGLEAVAGHAGVGRATLHRTFPGGRADLLRATALAGIATLTDGLAEAELEARAPAEALDALLAVLVRAGDRLHFLLAAAELVGDPVVDEADRAVNAVIHAILDRVVAAGVLRADVARAWRFRAIEALVYAAWSAVAAGDLAPNAAADAVRDAVRRGFGT